MPSITTHSAIALPLTPARRPNSLHYTLLTLAIIFLPAATAALFALISK